MTTVTFTNASKFIPTYQYTHMTIYIYIYRERERERKDKSLRSIETIIDEFGFREFIAIKDAQ